MLGITTKAQYFSYLDEGYGDSDYSTLKGIQDTCIAHELGNSKDLTIADIGGGHSRIFNKLSATNKCYVIDRFEGVGNGPVKVADLKNVTSIVALIGEFSKDVPDNFFDTMVSISVLEHVPNEGLKPFFLDVARCMKSGGKTFHAVDLCLGDKKHAGVGAKISAITVAVEQAGLKWLGDNLLDSEVVFRSSFASMSDLQLWKSWRKPPALEALVKENQVVNLMVGCYKP